MERLGIYNQANCSEGQCSKTRGRLEVMALSIVRRFFLPDGQSRELTSLFVYWFVGKNTTTPHHLIRVLRTNLDMLFHNTNHRWAYVIISTPVLEGITSQGRNTEQTLAMLKDFIAVSAISPTRCPCVATSSGSSSVLGMTGKAMSVMNGD